jgi:hypothetical protein
MSLGLSMLLPGKLYSRCSSTLSRERSAHVRGASLQSRVCRLGTVVVGDFERYCLARVHSDYGKRA